ncbi:MBL fold metallo-hydrolase [Promethearchaeum syntrophicum]|uniref:MBL fold metallo-hydrolase n=1 Tax=Promethearchaeum syntrophicum TaxID=2594042 RepID=A0A5B9D9C9_9ARCH|nr:MBL fold metallo-hydrolase [Candidatus Prometheoarchaeum syntrophicum]QEE15595.1 Ribonuclease BN [Candidatus Prometheoarchaeum syntrophicum]
MTIITESGKFSENLYLIDTEQFLNKRITTVFCYWDGKNCYLIDIGTSDNVQTILRFLKNNEIPLQKVKGLFLSHYHFDHGGGATKLWKTIHRKNNNSTFKIITTRETKEKLQNAESHVMGAKTTFGNFVGEMKPIPVDLEENAYEIISFDKDYELSSIEKITIRLLSTPGHSNDHCSPTIFRNGLPIFCFVGEASGCLYNGSELLSQPTSMPPNFQFEKYMNSLEKLINLNPEKLGLCHFGVISGKNDVKTYLNGHKKYMIDFRAAVIELYTKNQSTRYIIENLKEDFFNDEKFIDNYYRKLNNHSNFLSNLRLALTYGMMISLGFRKPKYELK